MHISIWGARTHQTTLNGHQATEKLRIPSTSSFPFRDLSLYNHEPPLLLVLSKLGNVTFSTVMRANSDVRLLAIKGKDGLNYLTI